MSIVKMKKFRMLAMRSDREELIKELQKFGCLEITQQDAPADETKSFGLKKANGTEVLEYKSELSRTESALKLLDKYAYVKAPIFPTYPEVKLSELFNPQKNKKARSTLDAIEANDGELSKLYAEENRLEALLLSLELWRGSGIPLDIEDTESVVLELGTLPVSKPVDELERQIRAVTDEATVLKAGSDKEQVGIAVIFHKSWSEQITAVLHNFGFTRQSFAGCKGTADKNMEIINAQISEIKEKKSKILSALSELGAERENLKLYYDRLQQEIESETAKENLLMSERVFILEGWVIADRLLQLEKILEPYCCTYETRDPLPDENVPIKLRNNKITTPLNMVTEMYSLPKYTNVDPNPLIAFWFCAFFGIMYADVGYGLVLLLIGLIVGPRIKRPGTMKYMTGLLVECGIATIVFGWLFGSFFGDVLNYIPEFFGHTIDMSHVPLWGIKDPSSDPMWFMYASLVVGCLHLLAGMIIKAYILIRDGHPIDAVFDVGSWWLLFAGIAIGVLKGNWWVALAGALALVLTQGRDRPTFVGKAVGGLASLYDITSWLGDILSYTRLMALMLAGGVIAQVFNMLGNMAGQAIPVKLLGFIVFLIIFFVTQLFNMAINIIGTFVHSARLQYLEFFGKFYEDGGKPFKPFKFNTKYTEIVKEED